MTESKMVNLKIFIKRLRPIRLPIKIFIKPLISPLFLIGKCILMELELID
jgi:hypothetical protein